jgi:hypothetical protein
MASAQDNSVIDVLTTRPARIAIAIAWVLFGVYAATAAPGEVGADSDTQLILGAINDPSSLNPIFFFIFNSLGLIPAVNLALLLPGSKDQSPLPMLPFAVSSFALGFGAVGPYLAVREPRPNPIARSELGFFTRYVTEGRLYGAGLIAGAIALSVGLLGITDVPLAMDGFSQLFASSKLVHVSTIDFAVLSALMFEPMKEDMARRGWWDENASSSEQLLRLIAFCIPVLGPSAYVLARPALLED